MINGTKMHAKEVLSLITGMLRYVSIYPIILRDIISKVYDINRQKYASFFTLPLSIRSVHFSGDHIVTFCKVR